MKPLGDIKGVDYFNALEPSARFILSENGVTDKQFSDIDNIEDASERYNQIIRDIELRQQIVRYNEVHPNFATATGIVGFALEAVTDPITIATLGTGVALSGTKALGSQAARIGVRELSQEAMKTFAEKGLRHSSARLAKTVGTGKVDLVPSMIRNATDSSRVMTHLLATAGGGGAVLSYDALAQLAEHDRRVDVLGIQEEFDYSFSRGAVSFALGAGLGNLGALARGGRVKTITNKDVIEQASPTSIIGRRTANKARTGSAAEDTAADLHELTILERIDKWVSRAYDRDAQKSINDVLSAAGLRSSLGRVKPSILSRDGIDIPANAHGISEETFLETIGLSDQQEKQVARIKRKTGEDAKELSPRAKEVADAKKAESRARFIESLDKRLIAKRDKAHKKNPDVGMDERNQQMQRERTLLLSEYDRKKQPRSGKPEGAEAAEGYRQSNRDFAIKVNDSINRLVDNGQLSEDEASVLRLVLVGNQSKEFPKISVHDELVRDISEIEIDEATKAKIDTEIRRLAKDKMKGVLPKGKDISMKDGDGDEGDEHSEKCWIISANRHHKQGRPQVVDRKRNPLAMEDGRPQAGDVCNFLISAFVPKAWPTKVCFSLEIVQYVEQGTPIGAGAADVGVMPDLDEDGGDGFDV